MDTQRTIPHRFVVIGTAATSHLKNVDPKDIGNQGQGDTGKLGLDLGDTGKQGQAIGGGSGPFEDDVQTFKGNPPTTDMGAIEFPYYGAAVSWLETVPGVAFQARYEDVYILPTFA
jgi:hypothetical protein